MLWSIRREVVVGTRRRVSALEGYIEEKVRERLEEELEAAFERLKRALPHEEARRVLEILAGGEGRI